MTEQLTPADALAQLSFLIYGRLERLAARHDLSMVQTRLLGVLRDRCPTMNELGRLLALDKSSVSGLVDRAERRSLVARSVSATDRRVTHVSLTDTGRTLVADVSSRYEAGVTSLLAALPPKDRIALVRLATNVVFADSASVLDP